MLNKKGPPDSRRAFFVSLHVLKPVFMTATQKRIEILSSTKKLLADTVTPVSLFLRLRDRYPGALLLESSDYHGQENSYSFICLGRLAGVRLEGGELAFEFPEGKKERKPVKQGQSLVDTLEQFFALFSTSGKEGPAQSLNGFFGFTAYGAISFFESLQLRSEDNAERAVPLLSYHLPRFILAINHYDNTMTAIENRVATMEAELPALLELLNVAPVPVFPFRRSGEEKSPISDRDYLEMVERGRQHCQRGDVFQIVLSRPFSQGFQGDDFNVYRALRSVNPSPYLFYFDYCDYRIFGSSPEAQMRLNQDADGRCIARINPIAGTFPRSGDDATDRKAAEALTADPKENAEHVMLVDLARNDLNRICRNVQVDTFREVQFYSHVIHLVSEVSGELPKDCSAMRLLAMTFPAGTLSGAPKYRAMQLIDEIEQEGRSFYGGCVGFFTFSGEANHAILIRSFLSKGSQLHYQAGAGVVKHSVPERELREVYHKIGALQKAVAQAELMTRPH